MAAPLIWTYATLFGGASDDDPVGANIQVDRPGEPLVQIFHFNNNAMLSTDGTEEQAVEVVAARNGVG